MLFCQMSAYIMSTCRFNEIQVNKTNINDSSAYYRLVSTYVKKCSEAFQTAFTIAL